MEISLERPRWKGCVWWHEFTPVRVCRIDFERIFGALPESFGRGGPDSIFRAELEGTMTICERCHGTGEIEREIGGDGYGNRCAGVADVPLVCPECSEMEGGPDD